MTQLTVEIPDALARRLAWLASEQKKDAVLLTFAHDLATDSASNVPKGCPLLWKCRESGTGWWTAGIGVNRPEGLSSITSCLFQHWLRTQVDKCCARGRIIASEFSWAPPGECLVPAGRV